MALSGCPNMSAITHQLDHDRFLRVQTVLGLLEYLVCVSLEYLGGDLLAAVSRAAVLNHCVLGSDAQKLIVYLIALERYSALLGLALLTHRRPYVGEQHVRVLSGFEYVSGQLEAVAVTGLSGW